MPISQAAHHNGRLRYPREVIAVKNLLGYLREIVTTILVFAAIIGLALIAFSHGKILNQAFAHEDVPECAAYIDDATGKKVWKPCDDPYFAHP